MFSLSTAFEKVTCKLQFYVVDSPDSSISLYQAQAAGRGAAPGRGVVPPVRR